MIAICVVLLVSLGGPGIFAWQIKSILPNPLFVKHSKHIFMSNSSPIRSKSNAPGKFYVDDTCINCDVCRWMCPNVFASNGMRSVVQKQPDDESNDELQAYAAMVSCPVGAIHSEEVSTDSNDSNRGDILHYVAETAFPAAIDPENIPGVYHCGYHAQASFGATSYFIKRPAGVEGGNIMIDCPRFDTRLVEAIKKEGGVHTMILTHRDDIADHRRWKSVFPDLQRIMHIADVTPDSDDVEIQLSGTDSWFPFRRIRPTVESRHVDNGEFNKINETEGNNEDEENDEMEIDGFGGEDIAILHTPGHTAGSLCVLYDTYNDFEEIPDGIDRSLPEREQLQALLDAIPDHKKDVVLFSGDTVTFDSETQRLEAFQAFNHGSLPAQERSIREVLASEACSFRWILPAHGRMHRFRVKSLPLDQTEYKDPPNDQNTQDKQEMSNHNHNFLDDGGDEDRISSLLALAQRCTPDGLSTKEEKSWRMRQKMTVPHPMA